MEFDYVINSGTFVGSQSISTYSDVIVYMYDVTNSQLIEPVSILLDGGPTGVYYHYKGTFQTNTNSTSYRFILHVATTSASAYTLKMDNFNIYPQYANSGVVVTDWQSFTPTGNFTTNVTYTGKWRRVGDSMDIQYYLSFSGATNATTNGTVNMPSGYSIDTTKILSSTDTGAYKFNSAGAFYDASGPTVYPDIFLSYLNTTAFRLRTAVSASAGSSDTASETGTNTNLPATPANGDLIEVMITGVPIVGWGTSVVLSNETDVRVVAARYKSSAGQSVSATPAILNFSTKDYDTHGAYSSGTYTCPFSGYYKVSGAAITVNVSISGANTNNMELYKNGAYIADMGVVTAQATVNTTHALSGETTIFCNAGDTLAVYVDYAATTTLGTNDKQNWISFERISGPSAIATTTTTACRYYSSTSSLAASFAVFKYDTKDYDTTGSYNSSTGVFTAPISGIYSYKATLASSNTTTLSTTQQLGIGGFKNGSQFDGLFIYGSGATGRYQVHHSGEIRLNAGDTFEIRGYCDSSVTTATGNAINVLAICRVGN